MCLQKAPYFWFRELKIVKMFKDLIRFQNVPQIQNVPAMMLAPYTIV